MPAHVRTRRNAGAWIEVDDELVGNLANLCEPHHREQHDAGIRTFERRHGLDLAAIAAVNGRAFRQLGDVHGAPF